VLGSNRIAFCVFSGNFLNAKIRDAAPLLMLSLYTENKCEFTVAFKGDATMKDTSVVYAEKRSIDMTNSFVDYRIGWNEVIHKQPVIDS